jgi:hypothetical protein
LARKKNLPRLITYWYSGLVVWTLKVMLTLPPHPVQ